MLNKSFCLLVVLMVIVALTVYAEASPQFFGGGFGREGGGFGGFRRNRFRGGFGGGFGPFVSVGFGFGR